MKKLIPVGIVALVIWFIYSQPHKAAETVNSGVSGASQAGSSAMTFIGDLGGGVIAIAVVLLVAWFIVKK